MKKRILSLLLALMMVVLLLPVTALAAETGIDTSALDMEYYGRYRDKGYSISVSFLFMIGVWISKRLSDRYSDIILGGGFCSQWSFVLFLMLRYSRLIF